eukprot:COSAG02_NODE_6768_length_3370_cov_5.094161_4_plen_155_part_00
MDDPEPTTLTTSRRGGPTEQPTAVFHWYAPPQSLVLQFIHIFDNSASHRYTALLPHHQTQTTHLIPTEHPNMPFRLRRNNLNHLVCASMAQAMQLLGWSLQATQMRRQGSLKPPAKLQHVECVTMAGTADRGMHGQSPGSTASRHIHTFSTCGQ